MNWIFAQRDRTLDAVILNLYGLSMFMLNCLSGIGLSFVIGATEVHLVHRIVLDCEV